MLYRNGGSSVNGNNKCICGGNNNNKSHTGKIPGDSVTISGNTTLSTVNIKILYPNGDPYNVESVQSSGDYSYTFRLASSGL